MKSIFENYEPNTVLTIFEEISRIPRETGNTEAISTYLCEFARRQGLDFIRDRLNNVVIRKPAAAGYETAPTVMLQGHMDMVAVKAEGVVHDFAKDPLKLQITGDIVSASGTTLGGDNGIALAYMLALLADLDAKHPALECRFTVDEEGGLDGAREFDATDMKASYLINLDSEDEGIFTISCAGGRRYNLYLPVRRELTPGIEVSFKLQDLFGGHSGTEIHKGRVNASLYLAEFLWELSQACPIYLQELTGGGQDNAIPTTAQASVRILEKDWQTFQEVYQPLFEKKQEELIRQEPTAQWTVEIEREPEPQPALSYHETQSLLQFLLSLPNGVQSMSKDLERLVQTSLNLGVLELMEEELLAGFALRSSVEEEMLALGSKLEEIAERFGARFTKSVGYPGWQYDPHSTLRPLAVTVYEDMYGKTPVLEAIHAGLECGLLKEKLPHLDILALGPDLFQAHTPMESFSLSSVGRVWDFLQELLRRIH